MKHELGATIFILAIFLLTQVLGLSLIFHDIKGVGVSEATGEVVVVHSESTEELRPQTTGADSFYLLAAGIAIGTGLLLLIVRFAKKRLWFLWYALAVFIALSISLRVIIRPLLLVYALSALLAYLKVKKPNVVLHNLTEMLMYSGIALLLVPIFNVFWALMLLFAISVYDIIAVYKSKHMVKMAVFTAGTNVFPGLMMPYKGKRLQLGRIGETDLSKSPQSKKTSGLNKGETQRRTAILGGGDVIFPLLFAGVVMESMIKAGVPASSALWQSLIIAGCAAAALAILFFTGKQHRFYPAMPVITAGCIVGLALIALI